MAGCGLRLSEVLSYKIVPLRLPGQLQSLALKGAAQLQLWGWGARASAPEGRKMPPSLTLGGMSTGTSRSEKCWGGGAGAW